MTRALGVEALAASSCTLPLHPLLRAFLGEIEAPSTPPSSPLPGGVGERASLPFGGLTSNSPSVRSSSDISHETHPSIYRLSHPCIFFSTLLLFFGGGRGGYSNPFYFIPLRVASLQVIIKTQNVAAQSWRPPL